MSQRLLVCTDLDRTLIPNGPQSESDEAMDRFKQLCDSKGVVLAYVSGRDQNLMKKAIADYALPQPDYVVGDVGTTLYHVTGADDWNHQLDWEENISRDWNGKSHADLKSLFSNIQALRLQENEKQNRFKLSYYVSLDQEHQWILGKMEQALEPEAVNASLIWSIDETAGMGLLDVLPERATKYHAIDFIRQSLGYSLTEILFSGDGGNDMEVLISPVPAVLVANAQSDVRDEAQRLAQDKGTGDSLYMAKGGFMTMNGNYSAGILEGAAYYYPILMDRLFKE
ncbi:MAG: HAD-IIB family hydrolase [Candidatus Thiodiazotropha sp. (ex Lucinoma aequizonata)]|nr:HAD-IIB family hydrolase [Candidatus Thiodiazotropha sp. (ex Lucinoma aequizonata)]MCU7887092.1 HAD-IIB family hydrolase [Candidatus Thiodiazotropha sp. (ex Lucinoma aequizonata)]MCU7895761.1 HAD-IIB family hydrolase [Candidatus Thiodiazotropha sp. (ex Lucinoma aequizonata)]MCU7900394.1 HAD-IIB family hydrolase [Candidatus Thiodiazotropha sp. (ex Lucinoma aequizonata)]MCU7902594.1 HAD-IIB family hydrolase [Candidatus Thiodiazotropha sp. (ex Lucinoma aequizonata)]